MTTGTRRWFGRPGLFLASHNSQSIRKRIQDTGLHEEHVEWSCQDMKRTPERLSSRRLDQATPAATRTTMPPNTRRGPATSVYVVYKGFNDSLCLYHMLLSVVGKMHVSDAAPWSGTPCLITISTTPAARAQIPTMKQLAGISIVFAASSWPALRHAVFTYWSSLRYGVWHRIPVFCAAVDAYIMYTG